MGKHAYTLAGGQKIRKQTALCAEVCSLLDRAAEHGDSAVDVVFFSHPPCSVDSMVCWKVWLSG